MKQLFILVLSLFVTVSLLSANKKTSDEQTVKQLVQKVKQSQGDERRKAMNALKVQLRSMNQNTRRKIMMDLQKGFSGERHGMQRGMQKHTSHEGLSSGPVQNMPSSGRMQTHSSPQSPLQSAPSMPHKSPQMPSQHFGQPRGHK